MPSKKSAIKELKKSKKRQEHNLNLKKMLKKEEKKIASLITNNEIEKLKTNLKDYVSKIDRAVIQKLIHKNKASRKKSQVLKKVHKLIKSK
ncbi:MAG: 30S ribosomal protein S20 [Candidatus Omnitrophota bacterium]